MKTQFPTKNLVKCFFAFIACFFWIVCCPGIYRGYGETIGKTWERSQRWRDSAAEKLSLESVGDCVDPVLELADFLENTLSKLAANTVVSETEPADEKKSWWDAIETSLSIAPSIDREGLTIQSPDAVPCIEVSLEGGLGMFLRKNSEIQVLKTKSGGEHEDEFVSTSVSNLEEDDMVLIFRDAERNSIFDILIDQLEKSFGYGEDAKLVKTWKEKLRDSFIKSGKSASEIQSLFMKEIGSVDQVTIRSWVTGPTMAPLKYESFLVLIKIFELNDVESELTFNSVKRLRTVARVTGRALNTIIVSKNFDCIDGKLRSVLDAAEIDLEEIMSAVDVRRIATISQETFNISSARVKKLFSYSSPQQY